MGSVTAQHVERLVYDDRPVPYVLTWRGEAATRELLTSAEAAVLLGVSAAWVARLAKAGAIAGTLLPGGWLLDAASVRSYRPRKPAPRGKAPSVPAGPLLRLLDARGGAAACGVVPRSAEEKAIERARRSGTLTEPMADRLAVAVLGLTAWEIWDWPTAR